MPVEYAQIRVERRGFVIGWDQMDLSPELSVLAKCSPVELSVSALTDICGIVIQSGFGIPHSAAAI